MRRNTSPPRPPAGPPATITEGAGFARDYVVKLYDRQDGEGVNWRVIAETLARSTFEVLDKLPDEVCRSVATRIHDGAYDRMANGPKKADAAASNSMGADAETNPSNTGGLKSPRPRPPRGSI